MVTVIVSLAAEVPHDRLRMPAEAQQYLIGVVASYSSCNDILSLLQIP